ncbi:hypothetical protein SLA2020_505150 [Shorea laevis]
MWKVKIGEGVDGPYLYSTNNYVGRQTWEFDPDAGTPEERTQVEEARQNFYRNGRQVKPCGDLLWLMQKKLRMKKNSTTNVRGVKKIAVLREKNFKQTIPPVTIDDGEQISYEKATKALRRAVNFFSALQANDGHWPAENAGPLFFLPPVVFALYITGHLNTVFHAEHRKETLRYIYYHQNEDGGWGLHIEGHSTMFCTALSYICMRILGEGPDGGLDNACARARKWILDHGSVTHIPSWGKTWLSILGIFDWSGSNPMPPEFWILPSFLPMNPAKMWCYCRMVYMPMSYLYGKRFVGPITPLIQQLREELYLQPYNEINWRKARHSCAPEDLYYPHPLIQDLMWDSLYILAEPFLTPWPLNNLIREKALQVAMKHIHYEDENSRYITIGCVEKVLCMLACWVEDRNARDGHWPTENAGPLYFLPPLVFALYIISHLSTLFPAEHRKEILRYIYYHQNEDGGWEFHVGSHNSMFSTALNYICMCILGEGPDGGQDNACARAHRWILDHGSVTHKPSWGKTWQSILVVFDWSGSNPMPLEFWFLSSFSPMHPSKMWCYCHMVYMPMSYLHGKRFEKASHLCAPEDLYYPHPLIQDLMGNNLHVFAEPLLTRWPLNKLVREKALQVTMEHIHYEDENSTYITIGCVEKLVLCMLACREEDPNGDYFKKHLARVPDYIWVAEDGMKMESFGSQAWDAGFAVQGVLASNLVDETGLVVKRGHDFIKNS